MQQQLDMQSEPQPAKPANEPKALVRQRRLLNRWSMFALVIVSAASTVLYVSNVIRVNQLLRDIETTRRTNDSLQTVNQHLRAETYRLESADHITRVAVERLRMKAPQQAPVVLSAP
jgi:cell division protein FtsL